MPTRQRANSRKIWLDSLGLNLALRAIQVASATPNVPKQGNTTLDRRALFDAPVLDMDTAASLEEIFDQVRSELELVISLGIPQHLAEVRVSTALKYSHPKFIATSMLSQR